MTKDANAKDWGGLLTAAGGRLYSDPDNVPVDDEIPNQFTFTDQTGVALSSTITSAAVTVGGLGSGISIVFTATGGTIDKNNDGNFQTTQTLANSDTMRARVTSSGSNSTAVNCVVEGGGVSDTFTATTLSSGGGDPDINPSYNTLTLQIPRQVGTAGIGGSSGLESTNRIYRAYPGIEYTIPVTWWGGSYPIVSVDLTNAPSGMVAEQYTMACGRSGWQIRWPNPDNDASNIGITITDSLGATDSGEWDIDVTTTGFFFVDSVNGDNANAGTLAAPWETLEYARTNTTAHSRLILRAGTYAVVTTSGAGTGAAQMTWGTNSRATTWIAYPGEAVTVDHGGAQWAPMVRFNDEASQSSVWLHGINFIGGDEFGVYLDQSHSYGSMFWNCSWDDFGPAEGLIETNQACIVTQHVNTSPTYGLTVLSCEFSNLTQHCAIKFYDSGYTHIVGNYVHDTTDRVDSGLFAYKGNVPKTYTMDNKFERIDAGAFGGDWATDQPSDNEVGGEFGYNVILDGYDPGVGAPNTIVLIRDSVGLRGPTWFYRNTLVGNILAENYVSGDGAVLFHRNVMINSDGSNTPVNWIFDYNGSTALAAKFTLTDNLTNASSTGILDANGLLTGASRTSYGPGTGDDRGHELP